MGLYCWILMLAAAMASRLFPARSLPLLCWTEAGRGGGEKPKDSLARGDRVPGVATEQPSSSKTGQRTWSLDTLPLSHGFWAS